MYGKPVKPIHQFSTITTILTKKLDEQTLQLTFNMVSK